VAHDSDDDDREGTKPEELKRIGRVIEIAALLAAQPRRWTLARLSARFEIGERQIQRDLELLRHRMGYTIARTRGGFVISGTPALPPLQLQLPEAIALALAAGLARDSGDVDAAILGAALARLEALVPPHALSLLRQELARQSARGAEVTDRARILSVLQQAWMQGRQARIVYETASRGYERSERVVEPYHLARHYNRLWLLTAHDHRSGEVKNFKVSRVRAATLLEQTYSVPADFDIAAYRGETFGVMRGEAPVDIALHFSARVARWLEEDDWDVTMALEPRPDGAVVARLRAGITQELLRWLLWFGPDCTVLAPDTLREQLHVLAREMVHGYRPRMGDDDGNE